MLIKKPGFPESNPSMLTSNILSLKTLIYSSHLIVNHSDNLKHRVILIRLTQSAINMPARDYSDDVGNETLL